MVLRSLLLRVWQFPVRRSPYRGLVGALVVSRGGKASEPHEPGAEYDSKGFSPVPRRRISNKEKDHQRQ